MIPTNGSSFGRAGGRLRRYPGGTEKANIFATVRGSKPKPPSRLTTAQTLNPHRMADLPVKLHALHPSALCKPCKELSAEAFLLRRNQTLWPLR